MLTCNTKHAIVLFLFNLNFYPFLSACFVGRSCNMCFYANKSHDQNYCIMYLNKHHKNVTIKIHNHIIIIEMLELKTHNHKQHPSLHKEAVQ